MRELFRQGKPFHWTAEVRGARKGYDEGSKPRVRLKTYIWKELSKALEFSHLILSTADTSKEKRYSENAELLEQCCLLHRFTFRTFCALFGSCTQHPLQTVDKASQSSLVGD